MKQLWLHKQTADKLIVFCNGWGMDEHPFKPLQSFGFDVLMLYDYTNLDHGIDVEHTFVEYKEVVLCAWSMGVWAGQQVFSGYRDAFSVAIAINGTLCPIDDAYGIASETVNATIANLDEKGRKKFYHRMCRDRNLYKAFIKNRPKRGLEDQKKELIALRAAIKDLADAPPLYSRAIIATGDYIMPTRNQLQFWPEKRVKKVDGSHFLFYSSNSWDELLNGWLE